MKRMIGAFLIMKGIVMQIQGYAICGNAPAVSSLSLYLHARIEIDLVQATIAISNIQWTIHKSRATVFAIERTALNIKNILDKMYPEMGLVVEPL